MDALRAKNQELQAQIDKYNADKKRLIVRLHDGDNALQEAIKVLSDFEQPIVLKRSWFPDDPWSILCKMEFETRGYAWHYENKTCAG